MKKKRIYIIQFLISYQNSVFVEHIKKGKEIF